MSTAVVAWLALAAVVGLGVALLVLYRRVTALARQHTDRKWELAVLRAEVGDLRRRLQTDDEPADPPARIPEQAGADDVDEPGRPGRAWPSSATAWRRDRGRPPARPRRRRPG